jgi:putative peptidoglycan lipid II flippase
VLLIITALASFLTAGSIAVFNLASNLQMIPLGVVALSYSVAAFPILAQNYIKRETEKFLVSVISSFRHILFWLLPISVLFIVLRAQIVRVVLGAGAFSWADTRLTAAALALFTLSLCAQGLILLLVRAFYAIGQTRLPLVINFLSSIFIIFFAAFLVIFFQSYPELRDFFGHLLRVGNIEGVSVLMLPLAYSAGMLLNFFLLFMYFEKYFGLIFPKIKKSFWQIAVTSLVIGAVTYLALQFFDDIFSLNTFGGVFMQGLCAGLLGLIVDFFLLRGFKNQELEEILRAFRKRFYKKTPIALSSEELP